MHAYLLQSIFASQCSGKETFSSLGGTHTRLGRAVGIEPTPYIEKVKFCEISPNILVTVFQGEGAWEFTYLQRSLWDYVIVTWLVRHCGTRGPLRS